MNKTSKYRKSLVKIRKELYSMEKEDIAYILDMSHSDIEAQRRLTTLRQRCIDKELKYSNQIVYV